MLAKNPDKRNIGVLILWSLIAVALIIEILRDAGRGGDFIGYVYSGDLVLNHQNIYSDPLNTWPPFFSLFSVPIALLDQVSSYGLRLLWLIASVIAFLDLGNRLYRMFPQLSGISYWNSYHLGIVIIPFLISFRYLLDNLANIQINIFMLWLAVVAHQCVLEKKYMKAGFLLGLSISLKVYTIFILLFYIYKRLGKTVIWTFFFIAFFVLIPFLVWGNEISMHYYDIWWHEIASVPPTAHHKNQSVFGAFQRLLTNQFPGHHFYVNISNRAPELAKRISYICIFMAAIYPAWKFRKTSSAHLLTYEWIFILTAIPILSPLSWKAYFIFLYPAYLILYWFLYLASTEKSRLKPYKVIYWLSVILTVFTTEAIAGDDFSDQLESISLITVGTIFLLLMMVSIHTAFNRLTPNGFNHN